MFGKKSLSKIISNLTKAMNDLGALVEQNEAEHNRLAEEVLYKQSMIHEIQLENSRAVSIIKNLKSLLVF